MKIFKWICFVLMCLCLLVNVLNILKIEENKSNNLFEAYAKTK